MTQMLRTSAAADFLSNNGKPTSASLLRKQRLKGPDDPGTQGPPWVRAPNGDCLYSVDGLRAYLAKYHAQLRPMAPTEPPPHLRGAA